MKIKAYIYFSQKRDHCPGRLPSFLEPCQKGKSGFLCPKYLYFLTGVYGIKELFQKMEIEDFQQYMMSRKSLPRFQKMNENISGISGGLMRAAGDHS